MSKICSKCKKTKTLTSFASNSRSKDKKHSWCKQCVSKARMKTYFKNPKRSREVNDKIKERNIKFLQEYLSDKFCIDCKNPDKRVLQFDHVRGNKINNVSDMVRNANSLQKIKDEIAKCEIRCANCHLIRHAIARLV